MNDLRLRGFQHQDVGVVERLWGDLQTAHLVCNRVSHPSHDKIIRHFADSSSADNRLIIADASNLAIGYVSYRQICAISRTYNIGISLLPASRGKGIGSRCLTLLESLLRSSWMAHKLQAQVISSNEASNRLFLRLDYRIVGTMQSHYLSNGSYNDVVLYEKIL